MIEKKKAEDTSGGLPYPLGWKKTKSLNNGASIVVRPIRSDDDALYPLFMQKCTPEDIRHRFFESMRDLPRALVTQLTHVDYDSTMAFVALDEKSGELLGVSRYVRDPQPESAEFTVITRSDRKGQGIGFTLMRQLIDYAKTRAIAEAWVEVSLDNPDMLKMCADLGFKTGPDKTDASCVIARLSLA